MFKKILVVFLILVLALLAFAATKPDSFQVARSTEIKAPPEKIHAVLNDFKQFGAWSPWEKLDPAMKRTFSGPAVGKGAVYVWEGNADVGKGRMEILDSTPAKITIQLDFLAPFETHNIAEYTLEAKGDSTRVTWGMSGPNLYIGKLMSVFISMDSMVGKDFENGLASLKAIAEK